MVNVQGHDFPDHLYYDIENQIWYEPLPDGSDPRWLHGVVDDLMGDVLVFTSNRIGKDFETNRSFAVIEGGKWVGAARAAFDGEVVAHNEMLVRKPKILNSNAYGEGWMLVVRAVTPDWKLKLTTGAALAPALISWFGSEAYEER